MPIHHREGIRRQENARAATFFRNDAFSRSKDKEDLKKGKNKVEKLASFLTGFRHTSSGVDS